jgi:ubiquinol-cytochrome c reductase cytochrome b subunit
MSTSPDDVEVPAALSGVGGWLDDRFHGAKGVRSLMKKVFPDHWSFMLGEIALWSFVILLLTGTYLALFFVPSAQDVVYHGSYSKLNGITMSQAYQSTLNISFDIRGGLLIRQIHHWAADLFMAAIFAHMLRIFFTGAYRKPREVNWLIGVVLITLGMLEGLFGYSLPDDQLSGAGLRILEGVLQGVPIVGTYLAFFLFDGPFPGTAIIPRLYILHVFLIPGLILALVAAHLFIMFHQKHTQMPGKGATEENVLGQPFWPYFLLKGQAWFFFIFGGLVVLATFVQINPVWLYGPYTPLAISSASQPDWYMGFLEGTLRMMPAWEYNFLGHTLSLSVFVPALIPLGVIFTGMGLWPFFEQWATGDKREHHINDRPRNAPVRTSIGVAVVCFYGIGWAEGANDVLADKFSIPLYTITWIARIAVIVVPIGAYFVTKRICIGLQRKDAALLTHGMETGIIRQLPNGGFIEVERPVSDTQRAVLESKQVPEPVSIGAAPAATAEGNDVPPRGGRGMLGRARLIANRSFRETIPVETNGHNGHDSSSSEEEHAGVGAGSSHAVEGGSEQTPPPDA